MAEVKIEQGEEWQGIKLFGKTILLQVKGEEETTKLDENNSSINGEDESIEKKRADKIVRCPRCKSMDTKFCYFNNYNVNQPRHFCKGCQRYWTAGGALRNVPVGAGRRKSKPTLPLPNYPHCFLDEPYWDHNQLQQQLSTASAAFHPHFPAPKRRRPN